MRVSNKGKIIPMEEVTWEHLCSPSTYVDFRQDPHIDFPNEIYEKRTQAIEKALKALSIKYDYTR